MVVGTNSVFPGGGRTSTHKRAPGDDCTVRSYQFGSVRYTLHQLPLTEERGQEARGPCFIYAVHRKYQ